MKKILNIILVGLLLVSMAGCNSNEDYSDHSTNNTNNTNNTDKNKNDTKNYYYKEINDDDFELVFHYKNEDLVSLDVSYWYNEEVLEEAEYLAQEYKKYYL